MNLSPGKVLGILTAVGPGPGRRVYGNSSPARVALAGLALTPGPHFSATLLPPASCSTQHSSGTPDAKKPLKLISPAGEPFEMPHQDKKCADYAVSRRVWSPSARHARPDGTAQNPKLSCSLQNSQQHRVVILSERGPKRFPGAPKSARCSLGSSLGVVSRRICFCLVSLWTRISRTGPLSSTSPRLQVPYSSFSLLLLARESHRCWKPVRRAHDWARSGTARGRIPCIHKHFISMPFGSFRRR
jgi:hypothetical protein